MTSPDITLLPVPIGGSMPLRVLLADDSDVMRTAIARLLKDEVSVQLVGEAKGFAETIQMTVALKPDALLLDIHMSDELDYPPALVKAQLLQNVKCILAMSVWNDEKAHVLAESFGAKVLLDKANLYSTLIPAIKQHCTGGPTEFVPLTPSPSIDASA
jgi:DNA-binding NarL/FixJ family response regulator